MALMMYRVVKLVTTLRPNLGRRFCDSRPPLIVSRTKWNALDVLRRNGN